MGSRRCRVALAGWLIGLSTGSPAFGTDPPSDPGPAAVRSRFELHIVHPPAGSEFDPAEPVFVAGEAFLRLPSRVGLDALLVLDVSASTGMFADEDVNRDLWLDREFGGTDSVLAAELLAASRVIEELRSERTRIGLVTFSARTPPGPGPLSRGVDVPARIVAGLDSDPGHLRRALARLRLHPPAGMTDMGAALRVARDAFGDGSELRDRIVLFFTDGEPTHPHLDTAANVQVAVEEAERCAELGIRVHTFAIGQQALANPRAPILIADATGGYFTPVERPGDLSGLAAQVARQSIRQVTVVNRTSGEPASNLQLDFDGSFSALVPLRPGRNVIEVSARALAGRTVRDEIVVMARRGAPPAEIPPALRRGHDELMREKLSELRRRTEELKAHLRRELASELEAERRQLERQRRELELEAERRR